jgi:hypothetical protein
MAQINKTGIIYVTTHLLHSPANPVFTLYLTTVG